jgi:hypothetical protein
MLKKDILYFLSFDFSLRKSKKEINFDLFQDYMFLFHNRLIKESYYNLIKKSL